MGQDHPRLGYAQVRGLAKADAAFTFRMIAYNLIRIPKLIGQPA